MPEPKLTTIYDSNASNISRNFYELLLSNANITIRFERINNYLSLQRTILDISEILINIRYGNIYCFDDYPYIDMYDIIDGEPCKGIAFSFMIFFEQSEDSDDVPPIESHIIIRPINSIMCMHSFANPRPTYVIESDFSATGFRQSLLFNNLYNLSRLQLEMLYTLVTTGEYNFGPNCLDELNINNFIVRPNLLDGKKRFPVKAVFEKSELGQQTITI